MQGYIPGAAEAPDRAAAASRTLVVSADPLYREGVKALLETAGRTNVHCVDSVERAGRFCSHDTPEQHHLVLWFVDVLDREAFGTAGGLRQSRSTGLCVVAESVDVELIDELLRERVGSFSVLLRTQKPTAEQIVRMLDQVADGTVTLDRRILQRLASGSGTHALAKLNAMDHRVLELIADGFRNAEIAKRTRRSEKAVEKHVGRLFEKLELNARESAHLDRRVAAARLFYSTRRVPLLPELNR